MIIYKITNLINNKCYIWYYKENFPTEDILNKYINKLEKSNPVPSQEILFLERSNDYPLWSRFKVKFLIPKRPPTIFIFYYINMVDDIVYFWGSAVPIFNSLYVFK